MVTAYLAADGYESQLEAELGRAGMQPYLRPPHERLFICDAAPVDAAWALNTWFDVEERVIGSIGDAARMLRSVQRSWAGYTPEHRGRARLIAEKLPPLSDKALQLGDLANAAPLGSWTLLEADRVLFADRCSSPFPNGETPLAEIKIGPPNRAYRKLWEAFVVLGRYPARGDRALDLGASPGGWTWLLAELGCRVTAVDRAPLDPAVSRRSSVSELQRNAFGLEPADVFEGRPPEWLVGDIACYPDRLFELLEVWVEPTPSPTSIFTVKLQGDTDHDMTDRLRKVPGARLVHLFNNKHELTLVIDRVA
jgi:23S rRNA (cytidine2498-2'-O)-methyltransferase